uniref:Uncharacterized protein n=1 Tax=Panagrolaimus sp. PS1159 TaxID=55785 RepID=A0AC35G8A6_9BILA
MPSLNRDILNEICEKLIIDGNQNAIFNFAFSGKESLEAIKWKFSTITHLELYNDCYKIGWDKPSTTFYLNSAEIYTEKLMKFIGGKVRSLHLDTCILVYFPILDNILQTRKLETISIGKHCHLDDAYELISHCSKSAKHLKILRFLRMKKFKKRLKLDLLTITENACPNFFFFSY